MTDVAASSINWHIEWHGAPELPVLALIHGFAGSHHTWDFMIPELEEHFHLLLIDLPGHGKTPLPQESAFDLVRLGEALGQCISNAAEEPAFLCGYSMGGRIALHTALYFPEIVQSLALIGASAGISDLSEREQRRQKDNALAEQIRQNGVAWFTDYWAEQPVFASQKNLAEPIQQILKQARLQNDPEGLAYSLEHFGAGTQQDLHPRLFELSCPLLLMAGSQDKKFCQQNWGIEQFAGGNVPVTRVEIHGAGHAAHVEAPDLVAQALIEFCSNL
jgi:2-succinyl-6-hydroxy-2,4-cyclohexadiene-1-carboxylate synthase